MPKFKVLMLNTLPITNFDLGKDKQRTAGNQTLYNTLLGYSKNDVKVLMISFCDITKSYTPFENIEVKQSVFYPFFKVIMNFKLFLVGLLNKKKRSVNEPTTNITRTGRSFISVLWSFLGVVEGFYYSLFFKPDLFYGYEIYSTVPSKRLAFLFNKPIVTRFQGTELGFFLNDEIKFWSAKDFIVGTSVKSDLVIMANDGTDGHSVVDKLGLDNSKLKFWINGLHDKEAYLNYARDLNFKIKNNLPEDSMVICTANRFVDWKRIDRIILLMKQLEKLIPNAVLLAIGDGPEMPKLTKLVKDLELSNIYFLGVKEHSDTIYYIANSDLYITLNHSGNLGNSILEALTLGIPIVTIKNKSVEKLLINNFNSILVSEDNLNTLPSIIEDLYRDINTIEKLKVNARNDARIKLLSWNERMIDEVNELTKLLK